MFVILCKLCLIWKRYFKLFTISWKAFKALKNYGNVFQLKLFTRMVLLTPQTIFGSRKYAILWVRNLPIKRYAKILIWFSWLKVLRWNFHHKLNYLKRISSKCVYNLVIFLLFSSASDIFGPNSSTFLSLMELNVMNFLHFIIFSCFF